jgi:hypothetical protein
MTSDTLHTHLRTVIEERLTIARVALSMANVGNTYRWRAELMILNEFVAFVFQHDPADAVRRYEADLRRLERHAPSPQLHYDEVVCDYCYDLCHSRSGLMCDTPDAPWPCDEIKDLAASLGVEVE